MNEDMVTRRRRGIFYLIEGEDAKKLAPHLGIKLTEKKIISPGGEEEDKISCGFPTADWINTLVNLSGWGIV